MHSEGILLGELKHGPLALIDEDMPIIMVIVKDHTYEKSFNAVQQVAARSVSFSHLIIFSVFEASVSKRLMPFES